MPGASMRWVRIRVMFTPASRGAVRCPSWCGGWWAGRSGAPSTPASPRSRPKPSAARAP